MAKEYKGFGSRVIRPNIGYEYPKKEVNVLDMEERDIVRVFDKSTKASAVITLAVDLGLGGLYAEEICLRAKIDKKKTSLNSTETKRVFAEIRKLLSQDTDPYVYYEEGRITEIAPLKLLAKYPEKTGKESFSDAVKELFSEQKPKGKSISRYEKDRHRIEAILKKQEGQVKGFEISEKENQKKGEFVYNHYVELHGLLEEAGKAAGQGTIDTLLREEKRIKGLDKKEKKVILEI